MTQEAADGERDTNVNYVYHNNDIEFLKIHSFDHACNTMLKDEVVFFYIRSFAIQLSPLDIKA